MTEIIHLENATEVRIAALEKLAAVLANMARLQQEMIALGGTVATLSDALMDTGNSVEQLTPEPKHICQTCGGWEDYPRYGRTAHQCSRLDAIKDINTPAWAVPTSEQTSIVTEPTFGCTEWKAST